MWDSGVVWVDERFGEKLWRLLGVGEISLRVVDRRERLFGRRRDLGL